VLLGHAGGVMDVSVDLADIREVSATVGLQHLCLPRGVQERVEVVKRVKKLQMLL
jgi:hypothetical protein